jgi:hypothetical protein
MLFSSLDIPSIQPTTLLYCNFIIYKTNDIPNKILRICVYTLEHNEVQIYNLIPWGILLFKYDDQGQL